jgi:hypothetical protein
MHREDVLQAFRFYYDKMPLNGGIELYLYSAMAQKAPWKLYNSAGYVWRKHLNGSHNKHDSEYYHNLIEKIKNDFPNSFEL